MTLDTTDYYPVGDLACPNDLAVRTGEFGLIESREASTDRLWPAPNFRAGINFFTLNCFRTIAIGAIVLALTSCGTRRSYQTAAYIRESDVAECQLHGAKEWVELNAQQRELINVTIAGGETLKARPRDGKHRQLNTAIDLSIRITGSNSKVIFVTLGRCFVMVDGKYLTITKQAYADAMNALSVPPDGTDDPAGAIPHEKLEP